MLHGGLGLFIGLFCRVADVLGRSSWRTIGCVVYEERCQVLSLVLPLYMAHDHRSLFLAWPAGAFAGNLYGVLLVRM